ncbi:proline-rich protein 11 [Alligator mississippiensis]|uniref:Proline-rich protein 11 n=1 Tax=Alligator mississippiensis TaxID=8496 RepID=A0A151N646_ALLMI|nr:proline-rich protein 11 [Alligator mississippiensis]
MAKYKPRRRELRARAKLQEERRRRRSVAAPPLRPAAPAPRSVGDPPPDTACSQSCRLSVWSVAMPIVKNAVKPLAMTVSSVCSWCQNSIAQSFEVIKDTIFPSRLYLRELNALRKEMQKLETEFSRLQGMLQMSGTVVRSSENSPCQRSPLLLKRVNGNKAPLAVSVKKDGPIQITMKDLLNVKLKKTQPCTRPDKGGSPVKTHGALITVSDLQSINLRPKSNLPPARIANFLITPSKNQLDLRKHLKRVDIKRSPGGTPLNNKENMATGTGLTPIMTQALKRKFQMAHPKSPSPAPLHTASSFDEQN